MNRRIPAIALALALSCRIAGAPAAEAVAQTPPMGWNSWDAYGLTLDEAQYRANAAVLAGLRPWGWRYAVIDEGWYMADPFADRLETRRYALDGQGRLVPAPGRFPSASDGRGFKALADWTHAQGLRFGIHIVRGIPKAAVERDLPIDGSAFKATEAADKAATCPWDDGNDGVADNAAGQAYYDSVIRLYADWGVDYLKVDCISDHPYRPTEIRQISEAIRKAGRPMVLSLSPGPTRIEHAQEVGRLAQLWRISNDVWDVWATDHDQALSDSFPSSVRVQFDNFEAWNRWVRPGSWPDGDMLPIGALRPHPGLGEPRATRLTADEARSLVTLWAIVRSPLIVGANLVELDAATRALLTNAEVLRLNQREGASRPVTDLPAGLAQAKVWVSTPHGADAPDTVAVFNRGDVALKVQAPWSALGLPAGALAARDLWDGRRFEPSSRVELEVPPHGVAVLAVSRGA
jgi:hypothetical protein